MARGSLVLEVGPGTGRREAGLNVCGSVDTVV